ncbi:MAG: alpha/beta hydrolase [Actinobacteria bacterium]|nr:alpha/beta hydrolase [Actinomycetota bacterium]
MAELRQLVVAGNPIALVEAGSGGRPLLLVHGFTGAKEDFGDWIDAFAAEGWWVVAPDLRGHGDSHKPADESAYSLALYAQEVEALVDELGWDRFALLGHSMGGMIAQVLAIDRPERIARLVLMDTHHGPLEGLDPEVVAIGMDVLRAQGLPALLELLDAMAAERAPADERVRATRPGYVEWNERKLRTSSPAMYAAMATELVNRPDRLPDLAEVPVPTRVVVGEQDKLFVAAARAMADTIPGADLVVIPDAAHSPQFENPDAWWAAVSSFLAG